MPLRDDNRREIGAARVVPQERLERVERDHRHTERRGLLLDIATLVSLDRRAPRRSSCCAPAVSATRRRASRPPRRAVAAGRMARRRRRSRLPRRTSSGRPRARPVDSAASLASGRIDTSRLHRVARASSACRRMISREHAPPTNPSIRPSAKTIARSPRCADTGARRATTVARTNDCPSRRNAAICSKRSMASILPVQRPHQRPDSCSSNRAARVVSGSRRPANCP